MDQIACIQMLVKAKYQIAKSKSNAFASPHHSTIMAAVKRHLGSIFPSRENLSLVTLNLSPRDYQESAAGALSQFVTYSLAAPLECAKTRMQASIGSSTLTNPTLTKELQALVFRSGGISILQTAVSVASISGFMNGAIRYGLFDHLKGELNLCASQQRGGTDLIYYSRPAILLASSACAEIITCSVLAPLDKLRVFCFALRCPVGLRDAWSLLTQTASGLGSLWQGLPPMLMKQLPYTAVRLSTYEALTGGPGSSAVWAMSAGLLSGAAGTLVSQPADVLMTRVCTGQLCLRNFRTLVHELKLLGVRGAYSGLAARLIMNAVCTALQMPLFEHVREALNPGG
mmetsp:Transcript_35670/g.61737  ORF Transcript_35670/g.61737 Transcript_35670/m.61737 type:complete len:343 (-) Transcript_35670:149-1177(-)